MNSQKLLQEAVSNKWARRKLNFFLAFGIPFNKPHGFKVTSISKEGIQITVPYKKRNLNHLKGIHACALATAGEIAGGISLLYHFPSNDFRLIMSKLEVEYFYQAKEPCLSECLLDLSEIEKTKKKIIDEGVGKFDCTTIIKNNSGDHICTVKTAWQLKLWNKVKTKV